MNQARVQAARARLQNTRIHAPFSGRVGLRNVSPGSFVDSSTVISTLDDISRIKLDFSVPETFLTVVSEGMGILAESIVYPDRIFEGTHKVRDGSAVEVFDPGAAVSDTPPLLE